MTSYYCVSNNNNIDTLRDYRNELIRNKEHLATNENINRIPKMIDTKWTLLFMRRENH